MGFDPYKFLSDPFGIGLPEPNKHFDVPEKTEATFSDDEISLDKLLWEDEDKLITLKVDGIKEKNAIRNEIVSTFDHFFFAVYIAMAAFIGGAFSFVESHILSMRILSACFFVGVLGTILRLRILREYSEKSKDFETRGLIYFKLNDKKKALDYFKKSINTQEILSTGLIKLSNILTIVCNWSLIVGMVIMLYLSFKIISSDKTFSDERGMHKYQNEQNHFHHK